MSIAQQLAQQLRHVYTGGNWTAVNLKASLHGLGWQQVQQQPHGFNSIARLVYHMHYYIAAVTKVLQGEPLTASDKYSFDVPELNNETDWQQMVNQSFADAETLSALIESLTDEQLLQPFEDGQYGSYYRNLSGIIEHCHYHLGQIILIRILITNS